MSWKVEIRCGGTLQCLCNMNYSFFADRVIKTWNSPKFEPSFNSINSFKF